MSVPSLGTGLARQGREAALTAIFNATVRGGNAQTFAEDTERVSFGPAPQEFKDAYAETVEALLIALIYVTNN